MLTTLALTAALAAEPDHAPFAAVLDGVVTDAGVRYDALAAREPALDAYVASLADVSLDGLTAHEQLALWINAYNALTLALIVDERPLASIRDLDGGSVWKTRAFQVAGQQLTLDAIEQDRIRKLGDARIHAAVNCASRGCPPLPPSPLTGATLDAALDAAARRWVATNAVAVADGTVALSHIFEWCAADFASYRKRDLAHADDAQDAALQFAAAFAPDELAATLTSGTLTATWADYDWSLNSAP